MALKKLWDCVTGFWVLAGLQLLDNSFPVKPKTYIKAIRAIACDCPLIFSNSMNFCLHWFLKSHRTQTGVLLSFFLSFFGPTCLLRRPGKERVSNAESIVIST